MNVLNRSIRQYWDPTLMTEWRHKPTLIVDEADTRP